MQPVYFLCCDCLVVSPRTTSPRGSIQQQSSAVVGSSQAHKTSSSSRLLAGVKNPFRKGRRGPQASSSSRRLPQPSEAAEAESATSKSPKSRAHHKRSKSLPDSDENHKLKRHTNKEEAKQLLREVSRDDLDVQVCVCVCVCGEVFDCCICSHCAWEWGKD